VTCSKEPRTHLWSSDLAQLSKVVAEFEVLEVSSKDLPLVQESCPAQQGCGRV